MRAVVRELIIERLGHKGDGVARDPSHEGAGDLFVPGALPGERVSVEVDGDRARLLDVLDPAQERVTPACRHFLACGGCAAQHMAPAACRRWKRDLVVGALAARGIEADVAEAFTVAPASRRRATFAARRTRKTVLLGFHGLRSHELVDLAECPVLDPAIVAALPRLRELLAPGLTRRGEPTVTVTASLAGLDVAVDGGRELDERGLAGSLADAARDADLARLTWNGEPVAMRRPPAQSFDGIAVVPPPGGFLQAVPAAEAEMQRLVADALGEGGPVADLFCGCGTFTLPLAKTRAVHGVEADAAALDALETAARGATGLKPVTVERRNLFRRPLVARELERYAGLVFDPPRAGAEAQARELARGGPPNVAAVSCNPATFARDARILIDGGYRLDWVRPVDQFLWSAHIELVAAFTRAP